LLRRVDSWAGGNSAVDLARAVCLAVMVEPGLLRRARHRLVPEATSGTESDLWFSPLVTTRNVTGIVLDPAVLAVLRDQLGEMPELALEARELITALHAGHPPAVRLEEEVIWTTVRLRDGATAAVDTLLRPAVKAMVVNPDGGRAMARWASQALRRLPDEVTRTEAAQLLGVGTALRLGSAASVARLGLPGSVTWLAPAVPQTTVRVGLELAAEGLRFVDPSASELVVELPDTVPLLIERLARRRLGAHRGGVSGAGHPCRPGIPDGRGPYPNPHRASISSRPDS
jgi:hypothetical protein